MPSEEELVLARLGGYCTGILQEAGSLTTEQAIEGMVESMMASQVYDVTAIKCLRTALVNAERAAKAHNRVLEARRKARVIARRKDAEKGAREAAVAAKVAVRVAARVARQIRATRGTRGDPFKVKCRACGFPTGDHRYPKAPGRPPRFHSWCRPKPVLMLTMGSAAA